MNVTDESRREAEAALSSLIGLPLTDMWRYGGMQKFEFGAPRPHVNKKAEEVFYSDFGLVANCDWHIDGPYGFELSWRHFADERRDDHAEAFYARLQDDPLVVLDVAVREDGSVRLTLSEGFALILDRRTRDSFDPDEWRFMPLADARGHLVLSEDGMGWSG